MACGLLAAAIPAVARDYDLVIINDRVMDQETRYDAIVNAGVQNGKIAAITKDKITVREAPTPPAI